MSPRQSFEEETRVRCMTSRYVMSNHAPLDSSAAMDRLLSALGEQLFSAGHEYDLIVIGGSALLALGLLSRPTQDIDVGRRKALLGPPSA